jgi:hemolysin activation/secretion protein
MFYWGVRRKDRNGVARIVVVSGLLMGAAHAARLSPSEVTPSDLRPPAPSSATITLPAGAGLVVPPNAANLRITLDRVVVEGGFEELRPQTDAIVNRLARTRISVADLYAAAAALEKVYGEAGHILVRVVVPPQKLVEGGQARLVVIDGFVESIDVNGVPEGQRAVVAARMASLIGRRHVTIGELERRLLLSSDDPGLVLRSTLAPGVAPGATRLVLEGSYHVVTGSVGVDNNQPRSLGVWAFNSTLQVNSAFGYGEQIYLTGSSGYNLGQFVNGASPLQIFGGGVFLPVGVDGLAINPEYTNSVTRPQALAGTPASDGYFQRVDFRVSYPLIRTRAQTLIVSSTLEWDDEYLKVSGFGANLYEDRYFVARFQADDTLQFSSGASAEALGLLSQGLGGRTAAQSGVPLSQAGATPEFTKLDLTLRWNQALPQAFQFTLVGQGQSSFRQPLMVAEQFALDGPSAVSGFPTGTFSVDEGALLRGELGRTFPLALSGVSTSFSPYVFAAGGRGFIDQPTALEQASIDAAALGLGLRTSADATNLPLGASLGVELARYYSDVASDRHGWRGNVSFSVKF